MGTPVQGPALQSLDQDDRTALEAFVVDNEDLERLEALSAEFNIFEAIRAVRHEVLRRNFRESSGIVVDVCAPHGVWLDRGELASLICCRAPRTVENGAARQRKAPSCGEYSVEGSGLGGRLLLAA